MDVVLLFVSSLNILLEKSVETENIYGFALLYADFVIQRIFDVQLVYKKILKLSCKSQICFVIFIKYKYELVKLKYKNAKRRKEENIQPRKRFDNNVINLKRRSHTTKYSRRG